MATIQPGMIIRVEPDYYQYGTETLIMRVDEQTRGPADDGWVEVKGWTRGRPGAPSVERLAWIDPRHTSVVGYQAPGTGKPPESTT